MQAITTNSTNIAHQTAKPVRSTARQKADVTKARPMTLFSFPTDLSKRVSILIPTEYKELATQLQSFHFSHRTFALDYRDLTAPYKDLFGKQRLAYRESMRKTWTLKEEKKAAIATKLKELSATDKKELLEIFTNNKLIESTNLFLGNNVYDRDVRELLK